MENDHEVRGDGRRRFWASFLGAAAVTTLKAIYDEAVARAMPTTDQASSWLDSNGPWLWPVLMGLGVGASIYFGFPFLDSRWRRWRQRKSEGVIVVPPAPEVVPDDADALLKRLADQWLSVGVGPDPKFLPKLVWWLTTEIHGWRPRAEYERAVFHLMPIQGFGGEVNRQEAARESIAILVEHRILAERSSESRSDELRLEPLAHDVAARYEPDAPPADGQEGTFSASAEGALEVVQARGVPTSHGPVALATGVGFRVKVRIRALAPAVDIASELHIRLKGEFEGKDRFAVPMHARNTPGPELIIRAYGTDTFTFIYEWVLRGGSHGVGEADVASRIAALLDALDGAEYVLALTDRRPTGSPRQELRLEGPDPHRARLLQESSALPLEGMRLVSELAAARGMEAINRAVSQVQGWIARCESCANQVATFTRVPQTPHYGNADGREAKVIWAEIGALWVAYLREVHAALAKRSAPHTPASPSP